MFKIYEDSSCPDLNGLGVLYFDDYSSSDPITSYDNGTFYDYDVHGNVKELIQDINDSDLELITSSDQTRKKVNYDYDLVSGNVNQVTYQEGESDEFSHKYTYDADNRITKVYTSNNGRIWEQDAKYYYYDHGPLARVEIGDKKVQASDFAYTIQGWLKGVNSEDLDRNNDQGKDGKATTINTMNGSDVYGYSLHYFDGDYTSRHNSNDFLAYSETTTPTASTYNLYNGNIKEMYTAGVGIDQSALKTSHTWYRYDQLNRIKSMDQEFLDGGSASPSLTAGMYASAYSYDQNGNLLTLKRWSEVLSTKTLIDDFTYNYTALTNQLTHVSDAAGEVIAGADLASQSSGNYTYTEIGELEADVQEEIQTIEWKVTGKVKSITRTGASTKDNLAFTYDAMGNRIIKAVYDNSTDELISKTFYIRDAQGNCMAIYEYKVEDDGGGADKNLYLRERNIYGSSRVGIENVNEIIASSDGTNVNIETAIHRKVGDKQFELSNHLGNVLEVISDQKITIYTGTAGSEVLSHYAPDVIAQNDYYPFGMLLPNRHESGTEYRYGYQGSGKDDEVTGSEGTSYTTHFRQLDPRVARWLTTDPVVHPWESPYVSMADNPIFHNDILGNDVIIEAKGKEKRKIKKSIRQGKRKSTTFRDMYNDLENSENTHVIKQGEYVNESKGESCTWCRVDAKDGTNGSTIYIDVNNVPEVDAEGFSTMEKLIVTIGHELGHAWLHDRGLDTKIPAPEMEPIYIMDPNWRPGKPRTIKNPNYNKDTETAKILKYSQDKQTFHETEASNIENMIRSDMGLGLRQNYTIYPETILLGHRYTLTITLDVIKTDLYYNRRNDINDYYNTEPIPKP